VRREFEDKTSKNNNQIAYIVPKKSFLVKKIAFILKFGTFKIFFVDFKLGKNFNFPDFNWQKTQKNGAELSVKN